MMGKMKDKLGGGVVYFVGRKKQPCANLYAHKFHTIFRKLLEAW